MPAADLQQICDRWLDLTLAEGRAIEDSQWDRLSDLQREKACLKGLWLAMDVPRSHRPAVPGLGERLTELMRLERQNLSTLERRMTALRQDLDRLDESSRNLRRIQRSYAARPPGCVTAYSGTA